MGNRLFQEAREFVQLAKNASSEEREVAQERAKNALSSAFANSTPAEQRQLSELQNELESLK
jgi:polyhydroxyalkanoate synthesis regulator phasin